MTNLDFLELCGDERVFRIHIPSLMTKDDAYSHCGMRVQMKMINNNGKSWKQNVVVVFQLFQKQIDESQMNLLFQ